MALPSSGHLDILEQQYEFKMGRWLEIEGLPFAIGTFQADSSFFSARAAADRLLGIAHSLREKPRSLEQTLDILQGGATMSGQVEFEVVDVPANGLSAQGDVDGSPIQWTGQSYSNNTRLSAAITAAATTIPILGSTAVFTANGYCYIGTEAIKIGAVGPTSLTGCTRGLFRSKAQAFAIGMPVTLRPTVMANRRCWYYQNVALVSETLTGASAGAAADRQLLRFSGVLRNLRFKDGEWGSFVLPARTVDQELDHEAFRTFRSFKIRGTAIMDAHGKNGFVTAPGMPGFSNFRGNSDIYNVQSTDGFTAGEYALVKIEDEYFIGQFLTGAGGSFDYRILHRGVFNSPISAHAENTAAQEVAVVAKYSTIHDFFRCSKFTSAPTTNSPLNADHPLLLMLQILLSTGAGTNTAGGSARNYDVLPTEWGMGLDYTRVDIQGIEAAAAEEPALRFGGVVTGPANFLALLRQTLAFAGYYYFSDVLDLLRINRCRPPLPDYAVQSITDARRSRTHKTGWDGNYSGAVREVHFKHNYNITDQAYERVTTFITAADLYAKGLARSIKYECPFAYNGAVGIPGAPPMYPWDIDQWLLTRRDFYRLRYGKPPSIVTERVDLGLSRVTIGDIVTVTHDQLPNETLGTRGMSNAVGEIIGRNVDDATNTITLRILMTGYQLGDYRFISPSLKVESFDEYDDAHLLGTFVANEFTDPVDFRGSTQTDGRVGISDPTILQAWTFYAGNSNVILWNADFSDFTRGYIDTFDAAGTNRQFQFVPNDVSNNGSLALTDFITTYQAGGMYITFDEYGTSGGNTLDDEGVSASERYAYGADASDKLGSTNDPHIFFPT